MIKRIFCAAVLLFLTLLILSPGFYFADNAQTQLTNVTQLNFNQNADALPLNIGNFESLSKRINMDYISFCSEQNEISVKGQMVTPVLTNESYFMIYSYGVTGKGITRKNITTKEKTAVIGSNLALKLFLTTYAVGKIINLNGEEYRICGVINENDTLINRISSDGKQRVYIPYTCYKGYEKMSINSIAYENGALSAPMIEQMNLSQYYPTNFSECSRVIESFKHLIFLLLFTVLCVITMKVWFAVCKYLIKEVRNDLKENYILSSIKSIPLKYILMITTALGIPTILLTVFFVADFSIFIPSKYIPYDNIFDFSYYIERIIENCNTQNSLSLTGDTLLLKLYANTFSVLLPLLIISYIFVISITHLLILKIKNHRRT
ncbi:MULTISPECIES: ABC transporter permease [unclassified Ruminococcus]|uniref:ABC transporter permease n=1 Tax=unclassified Ruminococcus TaxID=2608920 RepID=UPI00210CEA78|nr:MULTISPECIES: ABC transporter permease [unclassified Ruminococcus]